MDRIPTTSDGALGGNWETAATPMAGMLRGSFGGRRVSEAPEKQRPPLGQGHATGSRVAAQPSPPAAQPPLDPRGGRWAAGDVREWPGTLPAPAPRPASRSYWNTFVRWCTERNVQYWPASPETVSDHLRARAENCRLLTLHTIRNAISHTHRSAGLKDPFATSNVVKLTLEELALAIGGKRCRSRNISGRYLVAAEFDRIREGALAPRKFGRGFENSVDATRRGQLGLALCSLVLEAGLQCDQAAALEWGDLGLDDNDRPTVRIRTGSAEAGAVIVISERAFHDLEEIATDDSEADGRIFQVDGAQVAVHIRAAAKAAGLESRIAGEWPPLDISGASNSVCPSTVRVRASHWRAFCAWCDGRGVEKLPALAETVAEYLREESEKQSSDTLAGRRHAISHEHRASGYDDPCATHQVNATLREVRHSGSVFKRQWLDHDALQAIRAGATTPRRYHGRQEMAAIARTRGLVDIALCSVLYAARLTIAQAADLKWRDLEILGKDKARLTVTSETGPDGRGGIREIAGEAVRDLEAIRGDAGLEDSVFGLCRSAAYKRVKKAAAAAGLGVRPAAGSSHTDSAGPSHTATAIPSHTATAIPSHTATASPPRISE